MGSNRALPSGRNTQAMPDAVPCVLWCLETFISSSSCLALCLPSSFPCVLTFEPLALPLCTSCLGSINKGRTPFLLPQKNPLFPLPLSRNLCMTFVDPAGRASQAIRPYSTEPALPAKPFPGAKQRVSWFLEFEFLCLPH